METIGGLAVIAAIICFFLEFWTALKIFLGICFFAFIIDDIVAKKNPLDTILGFSVIATIVCGCLGYWTAFKIFLGLAFLSLIISMATETSEQKKQREMSRTAGMLGYLLYRFFK